MTRLLTLAALVAGSCLVASTSQAGDWHHGGHGVHHRHHGGHDHGHSGYGRSVFSNYGYGGFYGYGNGYGYQPRFRQGYAPRYRPHNHHQHGGLHVDIGRFHVLGIGGHH